MRGHPSHATPGMAYGPAPRFQNDVPKRRLGRCSRHCCQGARGCPLAKTLSSCPERSSRQDAQRSEGALNRDGVNYAYDAYPPGHGPNLNTLGKREPHIYGNDTLFDIVTRVENRATELDTTIVPFHSNHEGALIDFIQEHATGADGLIINAGSLTHTSIGLRDCIAGSGLTAVEVHISNVYQREEFRHHSYLSGVCKGVIVGLGWWGYLHALESLVADARAAEERAQQESILAAKTEA